MDKCKKWVKIFYYLQDDIFLSLSVSLFSFLVVILLSNRIWIIKISYKIDHMFCLLQLSNRTEETNSI